jgi:prepilin-type processing-associated H-X9-DG protein
MGWWIHEFAEDNNNMWPRNCVVDPIAYPDYPTQLSGRWYSQIELYSGSDGDYRTFEGYHCPAKQSDETPYYESSYGMNMELSCINSRDENGNYSDKVFKIGFGWSHFYQIDNPSLLVMYTDSMSTLFSWRYKARAEKIGPGEKASLYGYSSYTSPSGVDPVHEGRAPYLHADGHVSTASVSDWFATEPNQTDEEAFIIHAEKYFHPKGDGSIKPSEAPFGMRF